MTLVRSPGFPGFVGKMIRAAAFCLFFAACCQHVAGFAPTLNTPRYNLGAQCVGRSRHPLGLRMADDEMPRFLGSRRLSQIKDVLGNPEALSPESKVAGSRRLAAAIALLTSGVDSEVNAKLIRELSTLKETETRLDQELEQLESEVSRLEDAMEDIKRKSEETQAAATPVETPKQAAATPVETPQGVDDVVEAGTPVSSEKELEAAEILERARQDLEAAEEKARVDAAVARVEQEALADISKSATQKLDEIAKKATATLEREQTKGSEWEVSRTAAKKLDEIAQRATRTLSKEAEK